MNYRIHILLLLFCFTTCIHSSEPSFAAQRAVRDLPNFFCKKNPEEGFGIGTLVRTPHGYKQVEQLAVGSRVVAPDGQTKKVTAIAKRIVDQYVHLAIDNQWINIGRENKILTPHGHWMMVHELMPHSYVSCADGHAHYLQCTPIQSATTLYMLTVEGNELCLAPYDIVVHNAEVKMMKETMESILPQYVIIKPQDVYNAIINFLKEYNSFLKSKDINDLIITMELKEELYQLWLHVFTATLFEYDYLKADQYSKLPEHIRIEPCDIYLSVLKFLEKYNESIKSIDIAGVLSELEQFHLAQWVFKEWENAFKKILLETGAIEDTEMHKIKKWE